LFGKRASEAERPSGSPGSGRRIAPEKTSMERRRWSKGEEGTSGRPWQGLFSGSNKASRPNSPEAENNSKIERQNVNPRGGRVRAFFWQGGVILNLKNLTFSSEDIDAEGGK